MVYWFSFDCNTVLLPISHRRFITVFHYLANALTTINDIWLFGLISSRRQNYLIFQNISVLEYGINLWWRLQSLISATGQQEWIRRWGSLRRNDELSVLYRTLFISSPIIPFHVPLTWAPYFLSLTMWKWYWKWTISATFLARSIIYPSNFCSGWPSWLFVFHITYGDSYTIKQNI